VEEFVENLFGLLNSHVNDTQVKKDGCFVVRTGNPDTAALAEKVKNLKAEPLEWFTYDCDVISGILRRRILTNRRKDPKRTVEEVFCEK